MLEKKLSLYEYDNFMWPIIFEKFGDYVQIEDLTKNIKEVELSGSEESVKVIHDLIYPLIDEIKTELKLKKKSILSKESRDKVAKILEYNSFDEKIGNNDFLIDFYTAIDKILEDKYLSLIDPSNKEDKKKLKKFLVELAKLFIKFSINENYLVEFIEKSKITKLQKTKDNNEKGSYVDMTEEEMFNPSGVKNKIENPFQDSIEKYLIKILENISNQEVFISMKEIKNDINNVNPGAISLQLN